MLRLTSGVFNVDGLNVVDLATVVGAVSLVEELLNMPDVYRLRQPDGLLYDITYLTPQSILVSTVTSGGRKPLKRATVVPATPPTSAGKASAVDQPADENSRTSKSCLDTSGSAASSTFQFRMTATALVTMGLYLRPYIQAPSLRGFILCLRSTS